MFKKIIFTIVLFNLVGSSFSQANLNDYKYVIVLNKYDFLKTADQYQLNSLTKFLFNKYGFTAIMEDEGSAQDLIGNSCLGLKSNIIKDSGMFKTKLTVTLKNCKGEEVFSTQIGESREKDYGKAYNEALRNAFKSFETVNYSYQPNEEITALANTNASDQEEVEKLKEEIEALKKEKETHVAVVAAVPVVAVGASSQPKQVIEEKPEVQAEASDILYAQAIDNGFQLVDSSPKVLYKIKKTGLSNVFLVEGKQALVYQIDAHWVLEYYENNTLKTEILNIKF